MSPENTFSKSGISIPNGPKSTQSQGPQSQGTRSSKGCLLSTQSRSTLSPRQRRKAALPANATFLLVPAALSLRAG